MDQTLELVDVFLHTCPGFDERLECTVVDFCIRAVGVADEKLFALGLARTEVELLGDV